MILLKQNKNYFICQILLKLHKGPSEKCKTLKFLRLGGMAGGHAGRRRADQAGSTAGPIRLSGPAAQPPPPAPPGSYITVDG